MGTAKRPSPRAAMITRSSRLISPGCSKKSRPTWRRAGPPTPNPKRPRWIGSALQKQPMNPDLPIPQSAPGGESAPVASLSLRVIKARHDLVNPIGHILGFSEMLLEEVQTQGHDRLRAQLQLVHQTASRMMAQ